MHVLSSNRHSDIYVGVDCFGRGTFGGGGFDCSIAFAIARKYQLSMAVFAPGWLVQCCDANEILSNSLK